MGKKGTSKKQESFTETVAYNPDNNLRKLKPKDILDSLMYCIEHSDYKAFSDVVNAYIKLHNKTAIAKEMKVSRRALYHMVSNEANPTIKNIMSFYRAIKKAA